MISSIFGKTKPINYIILLGFLFLFYWFVHFVLFQRPYLPDEFPLQIVALGVLCFSVFVVNFIVTRNQITGTNAFAILYYVILIIVFPEVLTDENAIFCSFFLLLATRRIISMKSLKNVKLKILDATLWIVIASFFYDWALLYLVLVFIAIYFYEPKNIKNWLVPFVGVFTIGAILWSVLLLADKHPMLSQHYNFSLSFDTDFFTLWTNSTKLVVYTIITIVAGFIAFLKMGKLGLGRIITMRLVAISLMLGLIITFMKTSKDVYPVMITFFPGAVLMAKYVEVIKKVNIKELVLMASVLAPFVVLIVEVIVK